MLTCPRGVLVKINGETHYLWRTVDYEGEALESFVTKRRDSKAALKFLRKTIKLYGCPQVVVTDLLRSYGAAMKVIENKACQEIGHWLRKGYSSLVGGAMIRFSEFGSNLGNVG